MTYTYEVSIRLADALEKIKKKIENPLHYKPLRGGMKGLRRVHVDRSFVLVFEVFESENKVIFWDFDHHDNIYK